MHLSRKNPLSYRGGQLPLEIKSASSPPFRERVVVEPAGLFERAARTRMQAVVLFLVAALVAVGACSSAKPERPPPGQNHRTIAEGYSLLYDITSQQKGLKKLLAVKFESDPVDKVISDIAEYTGQLTTQLEDMASRYPALTVDTQFLPEIEVKTRESIASATTKAFLSSSGAEFERELLLTQRSALQQEQHLAKVMIEMETAAERRAFWQRVEERFAELRGEVDAVLGDRFFCHERE